MGPPREPHARTHAAAARAPEQIRCPTYGLLASRRNILSDRCVTRSPRGGLSAVALIAAMAVSACQVTPEVITFGRWVATTQPGATDGVTNIDEAGALEIARAGLAALAARGRWDLDEPASNELVVGQYVPSMIRLDSVDGRQAQSSSEVKDSWVFGFGRPGRGALVVVDADEGKVSTMSVDP